MITQTGRKILGKYLINQVPAYASYLAFGCGATPSNPSYYEENVFYNTEIASYQISGSTVTVTTTSPHNLSTGQTVLVEFGDYRYNGKKTITVPNGINQTTFTYTANITLPGITAVAWASSLVTYTTATAHNLRPGDRITTSALAPSGYNLTNTIVSVPSATTFTVYVATTPGTVTDGIGTVLLLNPTTITSNIKFTAPTTFEKTSLNFEMFRVPITSRSYVLENGVQKVILGGELPSQERYSITEMGVYSAGSNPYVSGSDSRMMFNFTQDEGWDYASVSGSTVTKTPIVNQLFTTAVASPSTYPAFSMNASDAIFDYSSTSSNSVTRYIQHQQPRMLDSTILLYGNVPTSYIELSGISTNFDKNNKNSDKIKLAFSIIPTTETPYSAINSSTPAYPAKVDFSIIFLTSADLDLTDQEYATATFSITTTQGNAYNVATIKLSDFALSNSNFSWSKVGAVRISAVAKNSSNTAIDGYYIALDGMRFDNEYDLLNNPVYGLTGYSKIRDTVSVVYNNVTTTYDVPILKDQNTNNLAEFKFALQLNSEV